MATAALPVTALASSGDRLYLASGSTLHSFDTRSNAIASSSSGSTSKPTTNASPSNSLIRLLAISRDGKHAVTLSDDKLLIVFDLSGPTPTIKSTRTVTKRGSHLSFSPSGGIILSDRVGDVYEYPLEPRPVDPTREAINSVKLAADPSLNPDADLLLGHVSVVTHHLITPDGKSIITADRDEHIRISRYPHSYVIRDHLFGSEGFVSAIHIPHSSPTTLLSAGGEEYLRLWNLETQKLERKISIWDAILPHRKVRSFMRKLRNKKRKVEDESATTPGFYDSPEGWALPAGKGVCIRKIQTVEVEDKTAVMFFSEG